MLLSAFLIIITAVFLLVVFRTINGINSCLLNTTQFGRKSEKLLRGELRQLNDYQVAFIKDGIRGVMELAFFNLKLGGYLEEQTRDENMMTFCIYRANSQYKSSHLPAPEQYLFRQFSTFKRLDEVIAEAEKQNPLFLNVYREAALTMGLLRRISCVWKNPGKAFVTIILVITFITGLIAITGLQYNNSTASYFFIPIFILIINILAYASQDTSAPVSYFSNRDMGERTVSVIYVKTENYFELVNLINNHHFLIQQEEVYTDIIRRATEPLDFFYWLESVPQGRYLSITATGSIL